MSGQAGRKRGGCGFTAAAAPKRPQSFAIEPTGHGHIQRGPVPHRPPLHSPLGFSLLKVHVPIRLPEEEITSLRPHHAVAKLRSAYVVVNVL